MAEKRQGCFHFAWFCVSNPFIALASMVKARWRGRVHEIRRRQTAYRGALGGRRHLGFIKFRRVCTTASVRQRDKPWLRP